MCNHHTVQYILPGWICVYTCPEAIFDSLKENLEKDLNATPRPHSSFGRRRDNIAINIENYRIPSFAVRALKTANLSGTPLVDLHRGEDAVWLTLTWKILPQTSQGSQRAESRGGTKDCRRSGPSKPAPSAGKRSCQPGQGTARQSQLPPRQRSSLLPSQLESTFAEAYSSSQDTSHSQDSSS